MVLVALIDWQYLKIPNPILLWALGLLVMLKLALSFESVSSSLISATASSGIMLTILLLGRLLLRKDALGPGDVKLAGLIGFMLGIPLALLSVWLAAVAGLAYMGLSKIISRAPERIPFGSFLAGASTILLMVHEFALVSLPLPGGSWLIL